MGPFVRMRTVLAVRAATFLSLAAAGSAAAFALDIRGGVGAFLLAAAIFLVPILLAAMLTFRSLRNEGNVAPLPSEAAVRDRGDEIRSTLIRLPLWSALVAMLLLLFGTAGAGMALESSLALVAWVALLKRWEASRALAVFADVRRSGWAWATDSPHYYVRRLNGNSPTL